MTCSLPCAEPTGQAPRGRQGDDADFAVQGMKSPPRYVEQYLAAESSFESARCRVGTIVVARAQWSGCVIEQLTYNSLFAMRH